MLFKSLSFIGISKTIAHLINYYKKRIIWVMCVWVCKVQTIYYSNY